MKKKLFFIIAFIFLFSNFLFSFTAEWNDIINYPDTIYPDLQFFIQNKYSSENLDDLNNVFISLDNNSQNIVLKILIGYDAGFVIVEDGLQYLSEIPTYSYSIEDTVLTVQWSIETDWNWSYNDNIEIGVSAISETEGNSGWSISDSLDIFYNNKLQFRGELSVEDSLSNPINSNDWIRKNSEINFSDLSISFYESFVQPSEENFSFQIKDNDNNSWVQTSGDVLDINVLTESGTDVNEIFTIDLKNISGEGELAYARTFKIRVDGTNPNTLDNTDNVWHKNSFNVLLSAEDNESGISKTYYSVNDNDFMVGHDFLINEEGLNYIRYFSEDSVGNVEDIKNGSYSVKIDSTPPYFTNPSVMPAVITDIYSGNIEISIDFNDSLSGIEENIPYFRWKDNYNNEFSEYSEMTLNDKNNWSFVIEGYENLWINSDYFYFQFKGYDSAGNKGESQLYNLPITTESVSPEVLPNIVHPINFYPDNEVEITVEYQDLNGYENLHFLDLILDSGTDSIYIRAEEGESSGECDILIGEEFIVSNPMYTYSHEDNKLICTFTFICSWQLMNESVWSIGGFAADDNYKDSGPIVFSETDAVYTNHFYPENVIFITDDSLDITGEFIENNDWIAGNAEIRVSGNLRFENSDKYPKNQMIKIKLYSNGEYNSFLSLIDPADGSFYINGFHLPETTTNSFYLNIDVQDIPGNGVFVSEQSSIMRNIRIDADKPASSDNIPLGWQTEPFTVDFNPFDYSSGVRYVKYSLDNGISFNTGNSVLIDEDGIYQLKYHAVDNVSNQENLHNGSKPAMLDKTAPFFFNWLQTPPNPIYETYNDNITIQVTISDNLSGFSQIERAEMRYKRGAFDSDFSQYTDMFSNKKGSWIAVIPLPDGYSNWSPVKGDTIFYQVKMPDLAGNIGESNVRDIKIIKINQPPVVTDLFPKKGSYRDPVIISSEHFDPDGNSVDKVLYQYRIISSKKTTDWFDITTDFFPETPFAWNSELLLFNVQLRARAVDEFDLYGSFFLGDTFFVDNQPPVTQDNVPLEWQSQPFFVELNASDGNGVGLGGIGNTYYSLDGGVPSELGTLIPIYNDGNYTVKYFSVDSLGNEESVKTAVNKAKLDMSPPVFKKFINPVLNEDTVTDVKVIVKIVDSGIGLSDEFLPEYSYKRADYDPYYTDFEVMTLENPDSSFFSFYIPEPDAGWSSLWLENVSYKVKAQDKFGFSSESLVQSIVVEDVNHMPYVTKIVPDSGSFRNPVELSIEYEDSDNDNITKIEYYYNQPSNKESWIFIGEDSEPENPYYWESSITLANIILKARCFDGELWSDFYTNTNTVMVDNVAPITSDNTPHYWQTEDFVISLTRNDGNGSGFIPNGHTYYSSDGSFPSNEGQQILINEEGIHTVKYFSIDNLGNQESVKTSANTAKLDKTGPYFYNMTIDPDTLYETDSYTIEVKVKMSDSLSGVLNKIPRFRYKRGDFDDDFSPYILMHLIGEYWKYSIDCPEDSWSSFAGDSIQFQLKCSDIMGNTTETDLYTIPILSVNHPPEAVSIEPSGGWYNDPIHLNMEFYDEDEDVISIFSYDYWDINNQIWIPIAIETDTLEYIWSSGFDLGKTVIRGRVSDGEFWSSYIETDTMYIDNNPPVTQDNTAADWLGAPFHMILNRSDSLGVGFENESEGTFYAFENPINFIEGREVLVNQEGTKKLYYYSVDALGNIEEIQEAENLIKIDLSSPVFENYSVTPEILTEDMQQDVELEADFTDQYSGIDSVFYRYKRGDFDSGFSLWQSMEDANGKRIKNGKETGIIPRPGENWSEISNDSVYFQFKCVDNVGNKLNTKVYSIFVGDIEYPPSNFHLLYPNNSDTVDSFEPEFIWSKSNDLDGDSVFYYLYCSSNFTFSDSLLSPDTSLIYSDELQNNTTYYWKVKAFDEKGNVTESTELYYFYTEFVNIEGNDIPKVLTVDQNFPNPFNPVTAIRFSIPERSDVLVEVYTINGKCIKRKEFKDLESGYHSYLWDGSKYSSGIYFALVKTRTEYKTIKMILLK